jgi:serine kinase of HPr protein (carbohydrate metabolism regulator)
VSGAEAAVRHAGLIARRVGGRWRGALIEGPAGAGKSDLALRALDRGFSLVADDRVILWVSQGRLFGRAPDMVQGLLEVRGVQVVAVPALPLAEVALAVRCGRPERIPEPETAELLGISVPRLTLDPREPSATAKLSRALDHFDLGGKKRI